MTILTPQPLRLFPMDAMMRLSVSAGWNQIESDWARLLALTPDLCYGIELDNTLAASATAFVHHDRVAWIGMVLTLPEYRGRGLARILLNHLLNELDARGISTIGLDATDMGAPLYSSLGFHEHSRIERWARPGEAIAIQPSKPQAATPLLQALAAESTILTEAGATLYLRNGRIANYLGPFTAGSESSARRVLTQVPPNASLYWDLFPDHPFAATLAASQGLTPARRLIRMYRGHPASISMDVLGIAGFEFG